LALLLFKGLRQQVPLGMRRVHLWQTTQQEEARKVELWILWVISEQPDKTINLMRKWIA
jgi:hypothetical protein